MYKLKENPIGIYEKAMPDKFDWATKIKIAKMAGFDFIEMSVDESDFRQNRLTWSKERRAYLREMLYEHNMYINSICLSGHRKYPFGSKDENTRKRAYKMMDQALELAQDLGVRNIQLAGYDVYYETSDASTVQGFVDGLKYAAKQATSAAVMLSIEIMDTEFIGTISRCLPYIEEVGSPWLNIYPDFGNLSQWCDDPEMELQKGIKHIVGIHLKDTKPGIFKCVPFGEGTVDFERLFAKLNELSFQGPFLVEMWADNDADASIEATVDHIRSAKEWLFAKSGGRFKDEQ